MLMGTPPNKTFLGDFEIFYNLLQLNTNFAFSRFSDGELWMMQGKAFSLGPEGYANYTEEDYKEFNPIEHKEITTLLLNAYQHRQENYFCGLSCRCCVGNQDFQWMLDISNKSPSELTWANLLMNANYIRFIQKIFPIFNQKNICLMARYNAQHRKLPFYIKEFWGVKNNAIINSKWQIEEVKKYIQENNVENYIFLFAAGPLSNIAIHELYSEYPNNTYIDVGSTLNPFLDLDVARSYLLYGIQALRLPLSAKQHRSIHVSQKTPNTKVCIW